MAAQAIIFDLSAFPDNGPASSDASRLLDQALHDGRHCALVTELPHREAGIRLRERFGDTAHHIFSVVLTGADYAASGHKAPYSIVLRTLELPPEAAVVVAASRPALQAARQARLRIRAQSLLARPR
jgi:beta-phosphoglucomutase-like phosphatase (HAD superfamily)